MTESNHIEFPNTIHAVVWEGNTVKMLDQRLLPEQEIYLRLETATEVAEAIRDMAVRGAPAIGIAAAYGVVLAAREVFQQTGTNWRTAIKPLLKQLADARPTAVNLFWAINRMQQAFEQIEGEPESVLLNEARAIHDEDLAANYRMGELGAGLIKGTDSVITHCNAGALATGGFGTALGVIRSAYARKNIRNIFACETRPWLQGARLTAWELNRDNIPVTLIADSAAGSLMQTGRVGWVIVGADRIAANGDVANKIGTYTHAVSARHHNTAFMVVAPTSTIDMNTLTGKDIPVEQRDTGELTQYRYQSVTSAATTAFNPVFDITPAGLIDVIVTERGVIEQPDQEKVARLMQQ